MPNYRLEIGSTQHGFQQSRAKVQIMGGGFANGKTTALVVKSLKLCRDYPGSTGLLGRATYPKLNDTLRKEWLKWCPPHWIAKKPTQEENTAYLVNGTVVNFRYIAQKGKSREDGTTTSNLLSASYDWIGIDQMEDPEIEHKDFLDLLGRLRGDTSYRPADDDTDDSMPSTGPRWFMITCNPAQNWVYHKVVKPLKMYLERNIRHEDLLVDSETLEPIVDLFESSTYENRANLAEDYIKSLEASYHGQMRERYLMGRWAAFEGLVYPEFDLGRHCITREQALKHLSDCVRRHVRVRAVEAYDFGLVSPTCYMLGFVDDFGRLVILDGFHKGNFPYTEHSLAIQEIRRKYMGYLNFDAPVVADPAIFKKQVIAGRQTATTISRLLADDGLLTVAGGNDTATGIAKVSGYICGMPKIPHVVTGEPSGPLLYVVDDLVWFIDEISGYFWKKNPFGQSIDEPVDKDDHAMDAAKYMLSKLPKPADIKIPAELLPPGYMRWQEMKPEEYRSKIKVGQSAALRV